MAESKDNADKILKDGNNDIRSTKALIKKNAKDIETSIKNTQGDVLQAIDDLDDAFKAQWKEYRGSFKDLATRRKTQARALARGYKSKDKVRGESVTALAVTTPGRRYWICMCRLLAVQFWLGKRFFSIFMNFLAYSRVFRNFPVCRMVF